MAILPHARNPNCGTWRMVPLVIVLGVLLAEGVFDFAGSSKSVNNFGVTIGLLERPQVNAARVTAMDTDPLHVEITMQRPDVITNRPPKLPAVHPVNASMSEMIPALFIGTAHMSDLYKALCLTLASKPGFQHNACPTWPSHVASETVTFVDRSLDSASSSPRVVAQFLYRPTGEAVSRDDIHVDLARDGGANVSVVYGRGILDLYPYSRPSANVAREVASSVTELLSVMPAATIIVYLPHAVHRVTQSAADSAQRLFSTPPWICVSPERQQSHREAVVEGVRQATVSGGPTAEAAAGTLKRRLRFFDAWALTAAAGSRRQQYVAPHLGHHYPPNIVARVLSALYRGKGVGAVEGYELKAIDKSLLASSDAGDPEFMPEFEVERECNCDVFAKEWCDADRQRRRTGSIPRKYDGDVVYENGDANATRFPHKVWSNGESADLFKSRTCGGDGSLPEWGSADVTWRRRRIDDRSPFKPTLYQAPCDTGLMVFPTRKLPYSNPKLAASYGTNANLVKSITNDEQCFFYVASSGEAEPYWFDADQCLTTSWAFPLTVGTSHAAYVMEAIGAHLTGYFPGRYRITTRPGMTYMKQKQNDGSEREVITHIWSAPQIDRKSTNLEWAFSNLSWTHFLVYRSGHDEALFGFSPQQAALWTREQVADIVRTFANGSANVIGALTHAYHGRPPFPSPLDPCMNPMRQDVYRDGLHCAFRGLAADLPDSIIDMVDLYWITANSFSKRHCILPDGHHCTGVPGIVKYASSLRVACSGAPLAAGRAFARTQRRRRVSKASPDDNHLHSQRGGSDGSVDPCDARQVPGRQHVVDATFSQRVSPLPEKCDLHNLLSPKDKRFIDYNICACEAQRCTEAEDLRILDELKRANEQGKMQVGWERMLKAKKQ